MKAPMIGFQESTWSWQQSSCSIYLGQSVHRSFVKFRLSGNAKFFIWQTISVKDLGLFRSANRYALFLAIKIVSNDVIVSIGLREAFTPVKSGLCVFPDFNFAPIMDQQACKVPFETCLACQFI